MERRRQQKFPDAFEEDIERKLWTPRRDRIFVPSGHKARALSYDIETPIKEVSLYAVDWDKLWDHFRQAYTEESRRSQAVPRLANVPGFCDDCVGNQGTWLGFTRSSVPEFRSRHGYTGGDR